MEEIAEQTGLTLVAFEGLGPNGTVASGEMPLIGADPLFRAEVQEATEEEERDLSELSDGSYVLVVVERIEPAHLPELDAIRDKVADAWKDEQRLQALEAQALNLVTQASTDFATAAKMYGRY